MQLCTRSQSKKNIFFGVDTTCVIIKCFIAPRPNNLHNSASGIPTPSLSVIITR